MNQKWWLNFRMNLGRSLPFVGNGHSTGNHYKSNINVFLNEKYGLSWLCVLTVWINCDWCILISVLVLTLTLLIISSSSPLANHPVLCLIFYHSLYTMLLPFNSICSSLLKYLGSFYLCTVILAYLVTA